MREAAGGPSLSVTAALGCGHWLPGSLLVKVGQARAGHSSKKVNCRHRPLGFRVREWSNIESLLPRQWKLAK